jgi:chaperone BCS1
MEFIHKFTKFTSEHVVPFIEGYYAAIYGHADYDCPEEEYKQDAIDSEVCVHRYVRPFGSHVRSSEYVQADAILYDVTNRPEVRRLLINGDLTLLNTNDTVPVKDGIEFHQVETEYSSTGGLTKIVFELSLDGPATVLTQYEKSVKEEFTVNRQNSFDTRVYYFDEYIEADMAMLKPDGSIGMRARDAMKFTKHEFVTGRTFDNMFFHQENVVRDRFRFFLNNRSWYDAKGIPYCLGMLLHGPPGCGKTSAIKAIANESNRHILNINLSRLHSKRLLKQLFYDPMLEVIKSNSATSTVESVYVPIEKRLFVIEDADCLLDSILNKRHQTEVPDGQDEPKGLPDDASALLYGDAETLPVSPIPAEKPGDTDELDLSTILNILDGVLETPGRILVLTTNYPQMFDDALLRPGRIDLIVNFRKCNADMLVKMANLYYDNDTGLTEEELWCAAKGVPEEKWTPAEVTSLLLRHMHNRRGVWQTLTQADPQQLFGGW